MLLGSFPKPLPVGKRGRAVRELPCTRPQIANTVEGSHACVPPQSHRLTRRIGGEREGCQNVSIIGLRRYWVKPHLLKFGVCPPDSPVFWRTMLPWRARNRVWREDCTRLVFGIRIALPSRQLVLRPRVERRPLLRRRWECEVQCSTRNKMHPLQVQTGALGSTPAREPIWEAFDGHSVAGRSCLGAALAVSLCNCGVLQL